MRIKKSGGKIFGAHFSKAEEKAMKIEIQKYFAELDRKNLNEIDAIVLWVLHEEFGFGKSRMKKFHDRFIPTLNELTKRYEMDDSDRIWLCTYQLKQLGVDIEEWNKEICG